MRGYLGQKQEEQAGFKVSPEDRVEKPEALSWYEYLDASGNTNLVAGGLLDQPYQPFMQIIIVKDTIEEIRADIRKAEDGLRALKQK